jgi:hypothetical protein
MLKSTYMIVSCLFFSINVQLFSQHSISKYEISWMIAYPISAIKVNTHLKEAMKVYKEVKVNKEVGDTLDIGGKLDAFRHTFTMAYLAGHVGVNKLRKLGQLHEKGNKYYFYNKKKEFGERADSLACEMDLRNNELGFLIGVSQKHLTKEELKKFVLNQITLGNAWYLKKNSNNEYVSCKNEPINIKKYENMWFLPKCLVKSNE